MYSQHNQGVLQITNKTGTFIDTNGDPDVSKIEKRKTQPSNGFHAHEGEKEIKIMYALTVVNAVDTS